MYTLLIRCQGCGRRNPTRARDPAGAGYHKAHGTALWGPSDCRRWAVSVFPKPRRFRVHNDSRRTVCNGLLGLASLQARGRNRLGIEAARTWGRSGVWMSACSTPADGSAIRESAPSRHAMTASSSARTAKGSCLRLANQRAAAWVGGHLQATPCLGHQLGRSPDRPVLAAS